MKLVWKYGRLSFISFLKSSIPLATSIIHTKISVPFHSISCPGFRFYIIITIVTFTPTVVARLKIRKRHDFEKIASAFGSFSTLSLPSSLPLPTSFIKALPLPRKIHCFRFHIPDTKLLQIRIIKTNFILIWINLIRYIAIKIWAFLAAFCWNLILYSYTYSKITSTTWYFTILVNTFSLFFFAFWALTTRISFLS